MNKPTTPAPLDKQAILQRIASDPNESAMDYLCYTLDRMSSFFDTTNSIPAISELLSGWATNPQTDLSSSDSKIHIRTITTLISFLSELKTDFDCFLINSDSDIVEAIQKGGLGHE
ncbi:hypothetical protein GCM10028808_74920 [Spirosoma migulaei]